MTSTRSRRSVTFIEAVGDSVAAAHGGLRSPAAWSRSSLTPLIRRLVLRYRIVDRPTRAASIRRPIPRGGGLAVAAAFLAVGGRRSCCSTSAAALRADAADRSSPRARRRCSSAARPPPLLGALDDLFQLRARWQLAGPARCWPRSRSRLGIGDRLHQQPVRRPASIRFGEPFVGRRSRSSGSSG